MSLAKCKACGNEVSKNADKCPNCGEPQKRKPIGCMGGIALIVCVLVIGGALVSLNDTMQQGMGQTTAPTASTPTKKEPSPEELAAQDAAFEVCKKKLQLANELGVLYAFDWKPPQEPYVVAGSTFFDMAIDGKQGFAETVNCFLMAGDDSHMMNFDILHWQTGRPVAEFSYGKLKMK